MEALLYAAGITDRQGRVEDGTTVTDFDPEETKRHISISAATAPIDWKQKMLNVIDVPGYFDFIGEMMGPLRVVETAAIVVNAVGGVAVGTEKAWAYASKYNVGKMFIVNQMDREHGVLPVAALRTSIRETDRRNGGVRPARPSGKKRLQLCLYLRHSQKPCFGRQSRGEERRENMRASGWPPRAQMLYPQRPRLGKARPPIHSGSFSAATSPV